MGMTILSVGTSVPSQALSQSRIAEMTSAVAGHDADETYKLSILYGLTGIRRRHVTLLDDGEAVPDEVSGSLNGPSTGWRMQRYETKIGPIALEAARAALERSGVPGNAITHLISISCTGFNAPGFDIGLIRDLGLDPSAERTHVGFMGCHGALNGLRVARAIAGSEPDSRILLCAAELCTLHFRQGGDAAQSVTNALFADGAAAMIGAPSALSDRDSWNVVASGSRVLPCSEDAMTWKIGDHGFMMTLGPEVPKLIHAHLGAWLEGWLRRHGLSVGEIGAWAVHPGGPRILDAVRDSLELAKHALDDSRAVLADYGNISSPTIMFILDRMMRRDAPRPCVALGFGPGLVVEAALIR